MALIFQYLLLVILLIIFPPEKHLMMSYLNSILSPVVYLFSNSKNLVYLSKIWQQTSLSFCYMIFIVFLMFYTFT
jgi:hypothetical protein